MPRLNTPDPLALEIGKRIKALLEQKGWRLEDLAVRMNGSKGHVSNIVKGLVRFTIHTLYRLALGLEVEPEALLPDLSGYKALMARAAQLSKEQNAAKPVRKKPGPKKGGPSKARKPTQPERQAT